VSANGKAFDSGILDKKKMRAKLAAWLVSVEGGFDCKKAEKPLLAI
jgi:hypothetical protein